MNCVRILSLILVVAFVANCQGTGGEDPGALPTTGTVALLLADDPEEEHDAIFVTIFEVLLLPPDEGGEPVVLFSSDEGKEVDILDLRDEDLLLSISEGVEAGIYEKIRLGIGDVRTEGGPCDDLEIKVPSEKIDLVPDEPIEVIAGGTLVIRLDMDADKAINLHVAGLSGQCIFRPVVHVETETRPPADTCPRSVFGTIDEIDDEGLVLDLGEGRGQIDVVFAEGMSVFDDDGLVADTDILETGDEITVKGLLTGEGDLEALAIIKGEALQVDGTADSAVEDGIFVMAPDSGAPLVGETDVSVVDETLILLLCKLVGSDAIEEGLRVTVTGKFSVTDQVFRACSVVVQPKKVEGDLIAVEETANSLEIEVKPEGSDESVFFSVAKNPGILIEGDGAIPTGLLDAILEECGPLGVVVTLSEDDPSVATEVRVDNVDHEAEVDDVDVAAGLLTLDGKVVSVLQTATILDLRDGQATASLADIEAGDSVRVFGLEACESDDVDFYAFVVLILAEVSG